MTAQKNPTIYPSDNAEGTHLTSGWGWTNTPSAPVEEFEDNLWDESFKYVFESARYDNDNAPVDVTFMPYLLDENEEPVTITIGETVEDFHLPHEVAYKVFYKGKESGILFQDTVSGDWGEEHGDLEDFSGECWFFLPTDTEDVAAERFSEDMGNMIDHVARTTFLFDS